MMQTTIHKRFFFILATAFAILGFSVPALFAQDMIPIDFGQTVQGTIDVSDPSFQDGRHVDNYVFNTTQPNQPYVITVHAPSFAVQSALFGSDPQQQIFLIQAAFVGMPGGQVQYSGTLAQPGQYVIYVHPVGDPAAIGPYTLSLGAGGSGGACPIGGTLENPISLQVGQSVNCELTSTDVPLPDPNGGIHFNKFFTFQAPGGPLTITATAQGFTPEIWVFDPTTQQPGTHNVNTLTFDFSAGQALIAITSQEVQATGPFIVQVGEGDSYLAGTVLFGLGTYALGSTWLQSNFDQLAVVACEPDWDIPGQTLRGCRSQLSTRPHSLHEEPGGYVASWRIDGLKAGQEYVVYLYCDVNGDGQWDGITNPLEGPRLWPPPGSPADFAYFPPRDDILLPYTLDVPPPPCGASF
jgi:hypothetical protein